LWAAGLWFYFAAPAGKRYRLLGWMFVIPFLLFAIAKGREYYTAGSYPLLFAGGAVLGERWIASRRVLAASALVLGAAFGGIVVPFASVNSWWWKHVASQI